MPLPGADGASLRRRLLLWLLPPLALVLVLGGIAAYRAALNLANDAYDRSLLDPALAIALRVRADANDVRVDLPPSALEALGVDSSDDVFFSVSQGGRLLAGAKLLPPPPEPLSIGSPAFYDARHGGEPVRVASVAVPAPGGLVLVQAAETRVKRERLARTVLIEHAALELLVLAVAFVAVWLGVRRGLAPVERLRGELSTRSHRDLRALPETGVPEEVRPLVREMNALLARLSAAIGSQQQFVADAAHQLRTPLAALQAQAEAARREPLSAPVAHAMDQVLAAARRAARLVHQLLTLASVDPGSERAFTPQSCDLARTLEAELPGWIQRADARRLDLGFELEPAAVRGDPALLDELAANLLDNALKYTPEGGTITLRSGVRDGAPFLEVEDDGPGIPVDERERVFERFHRVHNTPGAGAGLGLAIVREIAARHRATLAVSEPPRGGTRVTVAFPAAAA